MLGNATQCGRVAVRGCSAAQGIRTRCWCAPTGAHAPHVIGLTDFVDYIVARAQPAAVILKPRIGGQSSPRPTTDGWLGYATQRLSTADVLWHIMTESYESSPLHSWHLSKPKVLLGLHRILTLLRGRGSPPCPPTKAQL